MTCNILNATKADFSEGKKRDIPYYLVPGVGQIKNKKIVKSIILIGAELVAINYWLLNSSIYKELQYNLSQLMLLKVTLTLQLWF